MEIRNWDKVPCTIISSNVIDSYSIKPELKSYVLEISYSYKYKGNEYVSYRYDVINPSSGDYEKLASLARQYPSEKKLFCYVNPKNPGEASLKQRSLLSMAGLLFSLVHGRVYWWKI